jgi:alkylation response protein AidB-like acyl-CoA dehydrogenase
VTDSQPTAKTHRTAEAAEAWLRQLEDAGWTITHTETQPTTNTGRIRTTAWIVR